jgi:membrane fusion protein (multidrug efflux system)
VNADGSYGEVRLQMANNKLFDEVGIVETIEADFNNETGNIAFRATFQNPKKLLRHGETGKVLMPVKYDQALLIPQKATFEILDKRFVFVVGEDGLVQSRQIEIGAEMPHVYQVVEGLKSTDKILVEGLRKVKNKEKIKFEFVPQDEIIRELKELHAE